MTVDYCGQDFHYLRDGHIAAGAPFLLLSQTLASWTNLTNPISLPFIFHCLAIWPQI